MSHPSTSTIPVLKAGITLTRFESGAASPRFLLALGDSHFLVSAKTRALVLALLDKPLDAAQLEARYEAESGQFLAAEQLLALARQTLPELLYIDTPLPPRHMPFVVSVTLLPTRLASRVTRYLAWLFTPGLAVALLALFAALHIAVLPSAMHSAHGAWSAREAVALVGLFLLSGLVHELGHTAACRYFRCPHGAIGFGLYFIFPAWYADVTRAWQLQPRQRAVVDLGGVYFQSIFLIAIDAWALATGSALALKLSWLITFTMLVTLNPVFKFDGYWLLSDLSGLHNLHKQVQSSLSSLVATVIGRRTVGAPTVRSGILYGYTLLSIGYFGYFALFLGRELRLLPTATLDKIAAGWALLRAVPSGQGWELAVALGAFAGTLLWPAMVMLGAVFFLDKLRRSLSGIAAAVRTARALPPAAGSALEKS